MQIETRGIFDGYANPSGGLNKLDSRSKIQDSKFKMMMIMIMIMMMAWQWRPTTKIGAKRAGASYLMANWEPEKKQRRFKIQQICFFTGWRAV